VLDTNIFLSAHLWPYSVPALAYHRALEGTLLVSSELLGELDSVFSRTKFDRYSSLTLRSAFLDALASFASIISVKEKVDDCRDRNDNMILELALAAKADFIVTGDQDLLCLDPWRGVRIVTPAVFLEL
jgi:putative PIN family toxin of toxin-antitoxin system